MGNVRSYFCPLSTLNSVATAVPMPRSALELTKNSISMRSVFTFDASSGVTVSFTFSLSASNALRISAIVPKPL